MTQRRGEEKSDRQRPVIRFAPSPTGRLHLGHALSALFASAFAEAVGGRFLLRIEDTDTTRCRPEFIDGILEDLAWLGLEWEDPPRLQSDHLAAYAAALERLDRLGLIYRCHATRKELRDHAEQGSVDRARDPDGAPLPPGRDVVPDEATRREREAAGLAPALRLDMGSATRHAAEPALSFEELGSWARATGRVRADPAKWGDAVLGRKDTGTSYHLAVVIDDARQGVTHVVRGLDLYETTHLHRLLQAVLGLPAPRYCHHPLILDKDGRKLSKAFGSESLAAWRDRGASPADIRAAVDMEQFAPFFASLTASYACATPGSAK